MTHCSSWDGPSFIYSLPGVLKVRFAQWLFGGVDEEFDRTQAQMITLCDVMKQA